jgi:hypothetical protein
MEKTIVIPIIKGEIKSYKLIYCFKLIFKLISLSKRIFYLIKIYQILLNDLNSK